MSILAKLEKNCRYFVKHDCFGTIRYDVLVYTNRYTESKYQLIHEEEGFFVNIFDVLDIRKLDDVLKQIGMEHDEITC